MTFFFFLASDAFMVYDRGQKGIDYVNGMGVCMLWKEAVCMDQPLISTDTAVNIIQNWYFQDKKNVTIQRENIKEQQRELEQQWKLLEQEKSEFQRKKASEERQLEREKSLFEMKWKLLEEEWRKLVVEQEQMEKKKQFYSRIEDFEKNSSDSGRSERKNTQGSVSAFFAGVGNGFELKKRYKDLIKIFHPDNVAGDTKVLQSINLEYENLKRSMY